MNNECTVYKYRCVQMYFSELLYQMCTFVNIGHQYIGDQCPKATGHFKHELKKKKM